MNSQEWTTEQPTQDGLYWVYVKKHPDVAASPFVTFADVTVGSEVEVTVINEHAPYSSDDFSHWMGPIQKPEPPA